MLRHRAAIWMLTLALAGAALLAACTDDIPEASQESTPPAAAAENDAQQQARSADDQPTDDQPEPPTQLETVRALHTDWAAQLTSFEMRLDVSTELEDFAFNQSTFLQTQLEPLQIYLEIDINDLVGAMAAAAEEADPAAVNPAADEPFPVTIRMLLLDDRAYLSLSEEGWTAVPAGELLGADFSALTGGLSDDAAAAMTAEADLALLCAELTGAAPLENELDGVPVWTISCDVDTDAMSAMLDAIQLLGQPSLAAGLPVDQALDAIEALSYTLHISQSDGAPLAFNVVTTLNGNLLGGEMGGEQNQQSAQSTQSVGRITIATTGRLTAWNQPITFPTPTPLIEDDAVYE